MEADAGEVAMEAVAVEVAMEMMEAGTVEVMYYYEG